MSNIMRYAAITKRIDPIVNPMKIGSHDATSTVELMELSVIAEPRRYRMEPSMFNQLTHHAKLVGCQRSARKDSVQLTR